MRDGDNRWRASSESVCTWVEQAMKNWEGENFPAEFYLQLPQCPIIPVCPLAYWGHMPSSWGHACCDQSISDLNQIQM